MVTTNATPQPSRTRCVTISVTPYEERAVKAVANARNIPISHLLRERRLDEIIRDYENLRPLFEEKEAADAGT